MANNTSVAVWSVVVKPGKPVSFVAQADIRITGAALDATLANETSRSSVKLTYERFPDESDDEQEEEESVPTSTTILCSLTPGKIEQSPLDIIINEDFQAKLEVVGENTVHLSGNYIIQRADPSDSDEEDELDEEDAYHLDEVSSDVLEDPDELMDEDEDIEGAHIEEIEEDEEDEEEEKKDAPVSKKRSLEEASENDGEKLTKSQKKKLAKKLKAENGKAVPVEGKPEAKKEKAKEEDASNDNKKDKKAKKNEKKEEQKDAKASSSDLKTTDSGLKIKDVKVGSGKAVKKGDSVSMRYIGKFTDGKVFDSNTKGTPFKFTIGRNEVIKGWEEGILGMQAGGERLLVVPPKLGYGNRKMDGIPANSTLRFEVKLLSIN